MPAAKQNGEEDVREYSRSPGKYSFIGYVNKNRKNHQKLKIIFRHCSIYIYWDIAAQRPMMHDVLSQPLRLRDYTYYFF